MPENSDDSAIEIAHARTTLTVRAARLERQCGRHLTCARPSVRLLPQVSLQAQRPADLDGRVRPGNNNIGATSDRGGRAADQLAILHRRGELQPNVREAQAAVEGRAADINTALRDAAQQIGDAWADLDVARASIKAGKLEVRAARIAFEGVQEEAKVGARTTLDVLDAEQELLDARGDLVILAAGTSTSRRTACCSRSVS